MIEVLLNEKIVQLIHVILRKMKFEKEKQLLISKKKQLKEIEVNVEKKIKEHRNCECERNIFCPLCKEEFCIECVEVYHEYIDIDHSGQLKNK
jgi:hypothetical protein